MRRLSPRPVRSAAAVITIAAVATTLAIGAAPASFAAPLVADPASYVDPLVGSANAGNTFPGAVAPFGMVAFSPDQNRYNGPAAGTEVGPGTMRTVSPSGYEYGADTIRGFGLTHVSGAGCAGLSGDIPLFPVVGGIDTSPSLADSLGTPYSSSFSHDNETATAGSYQVQLDSGVGVDLSATTRTAAGRFSYPADQAATMLVRTSDSLVGSSDATVTIDAEAQTISGSVTAGNFCGPFTGDGILQQSYYTVYFTAAFDAPFVEVGTWEDDVLRPDTTTATGGTDYTGGVTESGEQANGYPVAGRGSGAYVSFDTAEGSEVNTRVGISYVSADNAAENLAAENPEGTTVDDVRAATQAAWNDELGAIAVGGGTDDELTTFYTALYHALLHPNIASDVDGQYAGFDGQAHTVPDGQEAQYATFSGWDVYRSQVQLVTLLDAKRGSDIAASLLNQAEQNDGVWDRWTHNTGSTHVMVGDPSAAALAGILAFGGDDFPVERAYDSLAQAARVPTELDASRRGFNVAVEGQRPSLDRFLELGYYPEGCNAWGCPNETLEMGAADYGLASIAERLGRTDDYDEFVARSQSWQNQFNPSATEEGGYIQGRNADGSWVPGYDPGSSNGFVEGTGAQYTWMVQHNPAGLFDAMGGADAASDRLDRFFRDETGAWTLTGPWDGNVHANMDNEPSIATPWLYNYAGKPWKTQETVRETIKQLWLGTPDGAPNGPDGIPGNDDLGQMSSWLVFAAVGLYPENPSRAELTVAAPLFSDVQITRADGTTLTMTAPDASIDNGYIQSMTVDGAPSTSTFLDPSLLDSGAEISYELGSAPNTAWGTAAADAPPSVRDGEKSYLTSASPATVSAVPGGVTGPVTLEAQRLDLGADGSVGFEVDTPDGLTADVAEGELDFDASGSGTAELTLRAAPSLPIGRYPVIVHFESDGVALDDVTVTVDVAAQVSSLIDTSFEVGQPQTVPNVRLDSTGFGEYCCGIGGTETKVQAGDARTGNQAVIYSARATAAGATGRSQLLDVDDVPARAGATLAYSIYPQRSGGPFGDYVQNASEFVAVDLLFTDGSTLGGSGAVASNGATLDPLLQGPALAVDEWNDLTVVLPDAVDGKLIDQVLITFSPGAAFDTGAGDGYARGWVDDLSLTEPVPPLAVTAATGLSATVGVPLSATIAEFTGGAGASADEFTATIDWGDDTAVEEAEIVASGAGSAIAGTHTFGASGTYSATVSVTDADGVIGTTVVQITAVEPPVDEPETPGDGGGTVPAGDSGDVGSDGLAFTGASAMFGVAAIGAVLAMLLGSALVLRRRRLRSSAIPVR